MPQHFFELAGGGSIYSRVESIILVHAEGSELHLIRRMHFNWMPPLGELLAPLDFLKLIHHIHLRPPMLRDLVKQEPYSCLSTKPIAVLARNL